MCLRFTLRTIVVITHEYHAHRAKSRDVPVRRASWRRALPTRRELSGGGRYLRLREAERLPGSVQHLAPRLFESAAPLSVKLHRRQIAVLGFGLGGGERRKRAGALQDRERRAVQDGVARRFLHLAADHRALA